MTVAYDSDIAHDLACELTMAETFSKKIIMTVKAILARRLCAGEEIHLIGFGTFHLKQVGAKTLRNPRTGALYPIVPHTCPAWLASDALREKIRSSSAISASSAVNT